jgi:hypothetical protein
MAYAVIGACGRTLLTLVFLPALYAVWFRVAEPPASHAGLQETGKFGASPPPFPPSVTTHARPTLRADVVQ